MLASLSSFVHRTFFISIATIFVVAYAATPLAFAEGESTETPTTTTETTVPTPEPQPTQTEQPPAPVQEPEPVITSPPAPPTSNQGPTKPTGAEGTAYTYNPATGMWESEKYIWDPATHQTKPKVEPSYSYNPSTGMWDTTKWVYSPETGRYKENVVSVQQPLGVAPEYGSNSSSLNTLASPLNALQGYGGDEQRAAGYFDLYYNNQISNSIASFSQSGNAWVTGNTRGGNALSGDALAMATIINLLQSSAGFNPGNFTTFVSNVYGDVQGDMIIDPNLLASSLSTGSGGPTGDVTINSSANNLINNDVVLDARSGDATVNKNTQAGSATTGNADAVANVVNMINSIIANNQSFLGTINIYGNLDGDILLPPEQLTQLLASSSGIPTVTLDTSGLYDRDVSATFNDTQKISNNIITAAASGNATTSHNTSAGNATTGDALTNVTLLNLTGRQVIGSNSLLVFVNVLGSWVGMIMNAPSGTTSAALGGGITSDGMWLPNASSVDATFDSTNTINNNLRLNAQSGNALVNSNTLAGDATSGDATASANVLNIINSRFVLSDWFGILFINVFGSWNGSFGVDTASGNPTSPPPNGSSSQPPRVFQFVSSGGGNTSYNLRPYYGYGQTSSTSEEKKQTPDAVLASTNAGNPSGLGAGNTQENSSLNPILLLAVASVVIGLCTLGIEKYLAYRKASIA